MTDGRGDRAAALRRWERTTDAPLIVAGVIFLAAYSLPILRPDLPSWLVASCSWLMWIVWTIFVVDFGLRMWLTDRRMRYLIRHWYDVLVVLLPLLKPLGLLRLVPLLLAISRHAQTPLRGRVAVYVTGGASLLAFCAALAVLDAERSNPDANIKDFGDAIWWAITTMTTVGYGDQFPVTASGRWVAFPLMVGGIALLGAVSGALASWLVEAVAAKKEEGEDLKAMLRRLEAKIDQLSTDHGHSSGSDHHEGNAGLGPAGEV
jgi:voltage-gated potassium channel